MDVKRISPIRGNMGQHGMAYYPNATRAMPFYFLSPKRMKPIKTTVGIYGVASMRYLLWT